MQELINVVTVLQELSGDSGVPKNVRSKIQNTITILSDHSEEVSMRINKALCELDEVADDTNMQSHTRTQVWNVVSLLEMI
jgi:uncharacterized protein